MTDYTDERNKTAALTLRRQAAVFCCPEFDYTLRYEIQEQHLKGNSSCSFYVAGRGDGHVTQSSRSSLYLSHPAGKEYMSSSFIVYAPHWGFYTYK